MARIPDADLERLKKNTDLAALVRSRGIELKKHGARDLVGRCPFHEEKTASLVVTPGKNLFHCLGCGAAGGPIDFLMKLDGVDFREAVDRLLAGSPVQRALVIATEKPKPEVPEERVQVLLERAVAIYQRNFGEMPEGRAYLEKRGLCDLGLLQRHRVGYANGRLPELLPPDGALRAELTFLGLLLADGTERFTGCVVFPVCDDAGRIVTLYGRYTGTAAGAEPPTPGSVVPRGKRHLYLPGRPRGLWNVAALRASQEIIAVESILDALSVETAGCANVISLQSANGDLDLELLRAHSVPRVRLLLDADPAGNAGTKRLKENLCGFAVEIIALPEGEDPNSFLMKHGAAALAALLGQRESNPPPARVADPGPADAGASGGLTLTLGLRRYEIRGLEKSSRGLRATIRVEKSGRLHVDTLDVNAARARRQLALDLVRIFEESADTIEADLMKLLTACETAAERRAGNDGAQEGGGTLPPPALSASDRATGEQMGRDPALVETILSDYERCGLVGERANKLLSYLVMTSRKLARPLALMNLASSGAGKSSLQDTTLGFCPLEDLIKLTSLSGKALFYKERNSLKNKVLALEEGDGVQEALYALRNLISAGELVTESTIKDPATGKLVTMSNRVEGPTAVFLTTTQPDLDPETKSRFFVTSVDESREQTERIMVYQRLRYTLEGVQQQVEAEAIRKKHHAFQRVLQPLRVIIPFGEKLSYGDNRLPGRRDQPKYLGLITAIAFLRQFQKEIKTLPQLGSYIEVDATDVRYANELMTELFGHSLAELSRPGYELLVILEKMGAERTEKKLPFTFTRRQVREVSGWAHHRVHRYMAELIELEYVTSEGGRPGTLQRYQLLWDGQGLDGKRFALGLANPDTLAA